MTEAPHIPASLNRERDSPDRGQSILTWGKIGMNKHGIKVGQTLWFVSPYDRRRIKPVVVESVGRKFDRIVDVRGRIDLETLAVSDDRFTIGICYLTESDWQEEQETRMAWRALRDTISRRPQPTTVTKQQIRDAAAMLGLAEFVSESEAP